MCWDLAFDRRSCYGIGVAGLAFTQPGRQPGSPGVAQPIGGLIPGEQDQRGLASAVVKCAFQRGEVFQQLGAQTVDRPGAIGHQIGASAGQDPQLHRDVILRAQRLQVTAHPSLIGDHRGVFSVGLALAAVATRGVVHGAPGMYSSRCSDTR